MSMSRAQLAAELWGRLGTQFTEAGITNIETTGNLKEPVDSTLLALGISYSDLATLGPLLMQTSRVQSRWRPISAT
jgi:hypothetical protein